MAASLVNQLLQRLSPEAFADNNRTVLRLADFYLQQLAGGAPSGVLEPKEAEFVNEFSALQAVAARLQKQTALHQELAERDAAETQRLSALQQKRLELQRFDGKNGGLLELEKVFCRFDPQFAALNAQIEAVRAEADDFAQQQKAELAHQTGLAETARQRAASTRASLEQAEAQHAANIQAAVQQHLANVANLERQISEARRETAAKRQRIQELTERAPQLERQAGGVLEQAQTLKATHRGVLEANQREQEQIGVQMLRAQYNQDDVSPETLAAKKKQFKAEFEALSAELLVHRAKTAQLEELLRTKLALQAQVQSEIADLNLQVKTLREKRQRSTQQDLLLSIQMTQEELGALRSFAGSRTWELRK